MRIERLLSRPPGRRRDDRFSPIRLLPLLRRTFATFAALERRQMGKRARCGAGRPETHTATDAGFDTARAEAALPLVARLLGLDGQEAR
jgi:hypothetical protein